MHTAVAIEASVNHSVGSEEISALDAARQLGIDLHRTYILLRLGRLIGRKVDGEWRVCSQSVADRLSRR
jgi:hypothetical protein